MFCLAVLINQGTFAPTKLTYNKMKKILFAVSMMALLLCACSKDEVINEEEDVDPSNDIEDIIPGLYMKDEYFLSFTSDGDYKAYLDSFFIDSGSFDVDNYIITCKNKYNANITTYSINSLDGESLKATIKYVDVKSQKQIEKNIDLERVDNKGSKLDNILIGKNCTYKAVEDNILNTYSLNVNSDCAATYQLIDNIPSKILTMEWNYVYLEPYIYTRKFKPTNAGLTLFYKGCDTGEVFKYKVEMNSDGTIKSLKRQN